VAAGPPREVRQSILDLLDRLPQAAAMVLDASYQVIAWNPLAAALLADFSALAPRDRNLFRRHFLPTDPVARHFGMSGADDFSVFAAGHLRAAAARYPDDPELRALIAELVENSAEFAALWAARPVSGTRHLRKTFDHPVVGPLTLNCDVLAIPDLDQHVVIYTAEPGSSTEEALRLLAVLGTQRMDVPS
jgi:hypothetical protein